MEADRWRRIDGGGSMEADRRRRIDGGGSRATLDSTARTPESHSTYARTPESHSTYARTPVSHAITYHPRFSNLIFYCVVIPCPILCTTHTFLLRKLNRRGYY